MSEKTLREHLSAAAKARHAKRTPAERSAHAKMMVEAREAKRQARKVAAKDQLIPALNEPKRVRRAADLSAADQLAAAKAQENIS